MYKFELGVHIYPTNFKYETRMEKIIKTLLDNDLFERLIVLGISESGLPAKQNYYSERCEIIRLGPNQIARNTAAKTFAFINWYYHIFKFLRKRKIDVINCHSISVLPICVFLKIVHGSKLIYEPHELETETITVTGFRKWFLKNVENILIKYASYIVVVSDSINERYRSDYNLDKVVSVFNVPNITSSNIQRIEYLHNNFNIPNDSLLFLYQGIFDPARKVDILLDIFKSLEKKYHIVFIGFGKLEDDVIAANNEYPNIHYLPALNSNELLEKTSDADVGFVLLDKSCINHECALPNKLYQYLNAGIPVFTSDLFEMRNLVHKHNCGWNSENSFEAIKTKIEELHVEDIIKKRENAILISNTYVWENEEPKLIELYTNL